MQAGAVQTLEGKVPRVVCLGIVAGWCPVTVEDGRGKGEPRLEVVRTKARSPQDVDFHLDLSLLAPMQWRYIGVLLGVFFVGHM